MTIDRRRTRRILLARLGAATVGGVLLCSVAGIASAEEYGDSEIGVDVQISEPTQPGTLAMTVAGTSTSLTEDSSTAAVRRFTGSLPTVTVTDTRSADQIPDDAGWYVLGSATAFTGDAGQSPIGAEYLGWTPRLIDGGESGLVAEGEPVETALDTGDDAVGLVDQELLALAVDSGAVREEGSWTADADLVLKTPATVEPGGYSSTITLSLFE